MTIEATAALIIIGNEVLSGRTRDANLPFLASELSQIGIRLREVRVIPDVEQTIIDTVNSLRAQFRYVFTTGGIGPTHDDITSGSVAKAFGVALERNPEAVARLQRVIKPENLNAARLRMADIPHGATLIDNPVSQAPGFILGNVYVMAGVPKIMQAMFLGIRDSLEGGAPVQSAGVTVWTGEGAIAADLQAVQERFPSIDLGSYPFRQANGQPSTVLVGRGSDSAAVAAAIQAIRDFLTRDGIAFSEGDLSPTGEN